MLKRNRIIYIPYYEKGAQTNEYIIHMIRLLEKKYIVKGNLAEPIEFLSMLKTNAVFLNWEEDYLDKKRKIQIFLHKVFGAQIIWVFHNRMPHYEGIKKEMDLRKNMIWLADQASHIVLHSRSSERYIPHYNKNKAKAIYVPHLMYERKSVEFQISEFRRKYEIEEDDFVFAMFGFMKPYKHFEDGIKAFQELKLKNAKLILAGSSDNSEYARYLKQLCVGCRDIILDFRYIPNVTLNAILGISDVIVIPYLNHSSMNSGVMIQAFSNARTVIVPNICMAKDFAPYKFLYRYRTSLDKAMRKAYENGKDINREMGRYAYEYVMKNNNEQSVETKLYALLDHSMRV